MTLHNDKKYKECERLYYLSDEMPASYVLGEVEMWKLDIEENMIFADNEIEAYIRIKKDLAK